MEDEQNVANVLGDAQAETTAEISKQAEAPDRNQEPVFGMLQLQTNDGAALSIQIRGTREDIMTPGKITLKKAQKMIKAS